MWIFHTALITQLVECTAVNRKVVRSSRAGSDLKIARIFIILAILGT